MARKPAVGFIVWKACVNWLWVINPVPLVSICEKSVAIFCVGGIRALAPDIACGA
jgi:hypothetical protein